MRTLTRVRLARLVFMLEQHDLYTRDSLCACHRPLSPFLTAVMRGALDDVVAAVADEPEDSRFDWIEVDK